MERRLLFQTEECIQRHRFFIFSLFYSVAHMWFDDKIFEADTTEDQSGTPMEKVHKLSLG